MTVLNFPVPSAVGETYQANGVVYTWNGTQWTASTTMPSNLDNRYVEVAGDTMTGSLNMGTSLQLNTDGTTVSNYAGTGVASVMTLTSPTSPGAIKINNISTGQDYPTLVICSADGLGDYPETLKITSGGAIITKSYIQASGKIISDRDTGTLDSFSASLNGNTNAIIRADGTIRIGGTVGSDPNIDLNPDGTITAANNVNCRAVLVDMLDGDESPQSTLSRFQHKGNTKLEIRTNGDTEISGQLRVMKRSDFGDELYGTHAVVSYNTSGSLSTMVSINYQGGSARVFEGRSTSTTATSYIQADGNASFVSTFAVNSYVKLDDGSNLDLKKVGLALVALKAAAAASNDYASLKSAIATALADL